MNDARQLAAAASGSGAAEAVLDGVGDVLQSTVDSVRGGALAADVDRAIGQLNSDGDSVNLRVTGEVKGKFQIGFKGQFGGDMSVTRNGDGPDATYTVAVEKHAAAFLTGQITAGPLSEVAVPKGEVGLGTADRVEMTFDSPEDAARAAETVQRLAMADAMSDAVNLPYPVPGLGTVSGGGSNPLANPLNEDGQPGVITRALVGVSQSDMDFLQDNVTAYEMELQGRVRGSLEAKLPQIFGPELAVEPRLDGVRAYTYRVEPPRDGEPGRESIRVTDTAELTVKEKATLDPLPTNQLVAGVMVQNRVDVARGDIALEASWEIPAGTEPSASAAGGRPVPMLDRILAGDMSGPDQVTATLDAQHTVQGPTDTTRVDLQRYGYSLTIDEPGQIPGAVGAFLRGDPGAAADMAGVTYDSHAETVRRDGFDHQHGLKFQVGEGNKLEATVILEAGIDDVNPAAQRPDAPLPPQGAEVPETYVVEPRVGLTLRDAADGERISVFQHGTFLEATGPAVTDADGTEWLPVSSTDVNDAPVTGFVQADHVRAHDPDLGAMDATGRTNPTLEAERYDEITVVEHDNLWDLAQAHGLDHDALVALNGDHLIAPDLIFEGDTVYVPGTARGPVQPEEVAAPASGSNDTLSGSDSGDTLSPSAPPTPSAPSASSPPSAPAIPSEPSAPAGDGGDTGSASGPVSPAVPDAPAAPPAPAAPANDNRPLPADILAEYQVPGEAREPWRPKAFGIEVPGFAEDVAGALGGLVEGADVFGTGDAGARLRELAEGGFEEEFTPTEAALLDELSPPDLARWFQITDVTGNDALDAVDRPDGNTRNPFEWQNDGHVDAYRHALWNARMTQAFGEDWTAAYATGHEKVEGNEPAREAMDLWNNEVGRRIAVENPGVSDAELQRLIGEALDNGELLVVDPSGTGLAWSDQIAVGEHGIARGAEVPGNAAFEQEALARDTGS